MGGAKEEAPKEAREAVLKEAKEEAPKEARREAKRESSSCSGGGTLSRQDSRRSPFL